MSNKKDEQPDMYYDRTLSNKFSKLIEPEGELRWLFDFVKRRPDLDFQIGKNNSKEWISVYRGLTRIISITYNTKCLLNDRIQYINIDGADSYKLIDTSKAINLYGNRKAINLNFSNNLTKLLTEIDSNKDYARYYNNKKEGYYQTILSKDHGIGCDSNIPFVIIDKEAVIGYKNETIKSDKFINPLQNKYKKLQKKISSIDATRYGKDLDEKSIGNELDFVALDKEGNILLIEYKHGTNTAGIYLSPLQIGLYADIFNAFPLIDLKASISSMFDQKQKMGLINPSWQKPKEFKKIIPVLIISNLNKKSAAEDRFKEILEISRQELGKDFLKNLIVYNFTETKKLEKLEWLK